MKVTVNQEECISCGACIELCPNVFTWGDYNKAVAYTNPVPEMSQDACRKADVACPVAVITIEE
jgi:ferredoxin